MSPLPPPPEPPKYKNELYLAVLPIVHISNNPVLGYGLTEETLTLFPSKDFATRFFRNEVQTYIDAFKWRAEKYLTGGRVLSYDVQLVDAEEEDRVVVKVTQYVG